MFKDDENLIKNILMFKDDGDLICIYLRDFKYFKILFCYRCRCANHEDDTYVNDHKLCSRGHNTIISLMMRVARDAFITNILYVFTRVADSA